MRKVTTTADAPKEIGAYRSLFTELLRPNV
jgi:hypothetical protein